MHLPPDAQAEELLAQAQELLEQHDFRGAEPLLEQALELWERAQGRAGAIQTLQLLALASRRQHVPRLAETYLLRGIAYCREIQAVEQEAELLANLGGVLAEIGETEKAVAHYTEARERFRDLLDREGEGATLYAIGVAYYEAGALQVAEPFFREAFPLLRNTESWTEEVAQMEQLVDVISVAQSVFGFSGGAVQTRGITLEQLAERLQAQAEGGSGMATRLAHGLSSLHEQMGDFVKAFSSENVYDRLLGELTSPDPRRRRQAARDLGQTAPSTAIEPLFEALAREEDISVLIAIVQALDAYGEATFAERLRPLLRHEHASVRRATVLALFKLGEDNLEQQLLEGLRDAEATIRAQTIQQLEKLGRLELAEDLLPMLQDRDAKVRSKAIYALGTLRHIPALEGLIAATRDRYQVVRWAAVRVLGELGDKRAADTLMLALGDSNSDVRRSAATALGKLKEPRAADALTQALADEDYKVRESARKALRKLKVKPPLELLARQLRDPDSCGRSALVELMAREHGQAALPLLREMLGESGDWLWLRAEATRWLIELGDHESLPAMLEGLTPELFAGETELLKTLADFAGERAEPEVIRLLGLGDLQLRHACIEALGAIGSRDSLPSLATIQLYDEGVVSGVQGFNMVSLRAAAARAIQRIRARHNLK